MWDGIAVPWHFEFFSSSLVRHMDAENKMSAFQCNNTFIAHKKVAFSQTKLNVHSRVYMKLQDLLNTTPNQNHKVGGRTCRSL